MTRMNKILEIDEENMRVHAQCGITLSELETKVRQRGFYVSTVFCPVHSVTLDGLMSGISGGGAPHNFAMGTNWRYILGLKVVLPTGTIIETGAGPGTNVYQKKVFLREYPWPDLIGLFIGDTGIFGVKTEATLQMYHMPESTKAGGFIFSKFEDAWKAMYKLMKKTRA